MKYNSKKEADGSYTISRVEIFRLGKHRGFNYDEAWGKRLVENQKELEKTGYQAPVIIGHNNDNATTEKAANGFLTNFDVSDGVVYADLTKVPAATYADLTDRRYPQRSVEVYNNAAKITALALLGGSEPYFKFPMLEMFQAESGDRGEITYSEDEELEGFFEKFINYVTRGGKRDQGKKEAVNENGSYNSPTPPTQPTTQQPTTDNFKGGSQMDREQFKATYGYYPEEHESMKAQLSEAKAKLEDHELKQFSAKLDELHVSPAAQEIIKNSKFAKDGEFYELIGKLQSFHAEKKLFVDMEQKTKGGKEVTNYSNDRDSEMLEKARAYAKEKGITISKAIELIAGGRA